MPATVLLVACGSTPKAATTAAFDAPPPPDQATFNLIRSLRMNMIGDETPEQLEQLLKPHVPQAGQRRTGIAREAELALAFVYEMDDRFDDALAIYDAAIAEHRQHNTGLSKPLAEALLQGAMLQMKMNNFTRAAEMLDESADIHRRRDRFGPIGLIQALNIGGLAYAFQQRFDEALHRHDEAVRLQPTEPSVYVSRAVTYMLRDQMRPAHDDLGKAFKFKRSPMNDAMNLAWYCFNGMIESSEVNKIIEDALKKIPRQERRQFDAAVTDYVLDRVSQQAIEVAAESSFTYLQRRNHAVAWFYIAARHETEDDADTARQYFRKCIDEQVFDEPCHHLAALAIKQLDVPR